MTARAFFDTIRTLGFAGISAAYASVGTTFAHPVRAIRLVNATAGDMLFTNDTTVDKLFVKAGDSVLWNIQANQNAQFDDSYVLPIGTQISVKQVTAPVSGAVYIECIF
jgi:hypothetical protein